MDGGRPDFEAWYQEVFEPLVRSMWVVTGDRALAEDVASEACVRALVRWRRVSRMASPKGWVFRVALNLSRREGPKAARTGSGDRPPDSAVGPEETDIELWRAVSVLPERQRLAVALRYLADLTEAEVAVAMGCSLGAASATLSKARRGLAVALREPMTEVDS